MGNWATKADSIASLERLVKKLQEKGEAVNSVVVETYYRDTWGRSGSKNAQIAAIQRHKFGRNPFFLRADEMKHLQAMFRAAISKAIRGNRGAIKAAAQQVAVAVVEAYRKHIEGGQNVRGPMAPLSKSRAIKKNKEHGEQLPILVDTGQLFESLAFRVREIFS